MYVILMGEFELSELEDTMNLLGPFDSQEAAVQYGSRNLADQEWYVIPLDQPADEGGQ